MECKNKSLKVENSTRVRGQKIHLRSGNRVAVLEFHRSVWRDGERYTGKTLGFVVVFNLTSPRMTHGFT